MSDDVKKIISAPEDQRGKHLQDVIGDLDLDDLDFVDFYEVDDEPETLEIRVRGRLKHKIGKAPTTKEKEDANSDDDAWERARGVV